MKTLKYLILFVLPFTEVLKAQDQGMSDKTFSLVIGEKVSMDFVWVEALKLWAGKYEVTNEQYQKFMRFRDGKSIEGLALDGDRQPAVFVSYCDALGFCHWLNTNTQIPENFKVRLPSGNEWTYLATAGDDRKFPWGNSWPPEKGNYLDQTGYDSLGWDWSIRGYTDGFAVSADVTLTYANPLGISGIGGNVREWTSESAKDGSWHVIRGASWRDGGEEKLRCSYGVAGAMWGKDNHIGLRVIMSR